MSKISYIIFLGVLVFLAPFTAFPSAWKTVFYVVAGFLIAVIGSLCRKENRAKALPKDFQAPAVSSSFVENNHSIQNN
ncbi:MAG: hypothetical protein WC250_01505 [Candidatus Paceibacterota bacterium]|jgi:hypothetical protein